MGIKPEKTTQFVKDQKKAHKQNKDFEVLNNVIRLLIEEKPLDPKYKDHPLVGNWKGARDCHVQNDWVLIYRINKSEKTIRFERLGSHSELFK